MGIAIARGIGYLAPLITALLLITACGGAQSLRDPASVQQDILSEVNKLRSIHLLPPLAINETLNAVADGSAKEAASKGKAVSDDNRLPDLVSAGVFARFALSHALKASSLAEVTHAFTTNPIVTSKILHPSLTDLGFGFEKVRGQVFAVLDLARLVSPIDATRARTSLTTLLGRKRTLNSVEPIEAKQDLNVIAQEIADGYMAQKGTSDVLIEAAQAKLQAATFAMGRVTIHFQVASEFDSVLIPERASDPSLSFFGFGIAQGNHPDHEPGAVTVVTLLAESQTAHDSTRDLSSLPPPKAVLRSQVKSDKSLTDQAWTATLTGNHRKAAKLFEQAYRKYRQPILIYEAARAHARNGDTKSALINMRIFAGMAQGDEKKQADEMVKRLEKGETIFTTSKKEQMSTEAKRFFMMGKTLFEQEQWDGAVDAFQQAYSYSRQAEIIYNIGLAHLRAGRIGEALNFFGEYQRQVPAATNVDEAKQFFDIGIELYKTGQFESASSHFAMAYSFLPFPELVYNLGLCYKAMGENDKAIRFLKEYLANDLPIEERQEVESIVQALEKPGAASP